MGHSIAAFVIPVSVADTLRSRGFEHLHLVRLEQEFFLVPVTDAFFNEVDAYYPAEAEDYREFWLLSGSLAAFATDLSQSGPVAYVETDYDGGSGTQAAVAWKEGRIASSPRKSKLGAINDALFAIGAQRTDGRDQFDVLGLDRYRSGRDCLEAAELQSADDSTDTVEEVKLPLRERLLQAVRRLLSK
jgi:hypothetical protein